MSSSFSSAEKSKPVVEFVAVVTCFKLCDFEMEREDTAAAAVAVAGDEFKIRKCGTLTSELKELSTVTGDL